MDNRSSGLRTVRMTARLGSPTRTSIRMLILHWRGTLFRAVGETENATPFKGVI
jgi:hypothetical protein